MFCSKCGNQVQDNVKFCGNCGNKLTCSPPPPPQSPNTSANNTQHMNLIQSLSDKIHIDVIIWLVVASLQVVIGIFNIILGISLMYYDEGFSNIILGIFVLIIAVLNFINAYRDNIYRKEILHKPVGINAKYEPIGAYIANLIYNLIFGGVIGVVGSIYGLYIRNFVISNKMAFDNIELEYNQNLK